MSTLSPEAELAFTRGLLHLRRGEQIMPYAMATREDKTPPGADVFLSLISLATVATSKALGQTGWIDRYQSEMRQALTYFKQAQPLAPDHADLYYRMAQAYRYLGESQAAQDAAREAVALAPHNKEFVSFLKLVAPNAPTPQTNTPAPMPAMSNTKNGTSSTLPRPRTGLTWDDVILPEKTKRELRQMQLMIENSGLARSLGVEPPTGLLLYGPPGTGKTTIARILAAQAKCKFLTASGAEINSMWVGESERAVSKIFNEARASAPAIIFLDEVDALIPTRAGGVHMFSDKVVNQFLHEIDGLKPNQGVFVVGATNRKDMLDPALLRGGRLSRQIEIPLPIEAARRQMLALMLSQTQIAPDVDVDHLAEATDGFSGADLKALVTEAGLQALIRLTDSGGMKALTVPDFIEALTNLQKERTK